MTPPVTEADFDALVAPHREELRAYCYRLLGSIHDADDALQETLLGAWRGIAGFEGRSTVRAWLYKCATHACYQLVARRPKRIVSSDFGPPTRGTDIDAMVNEPIWLEPFPADPSASYEALESVELAFVAALQHLPATQRAALVMHEALGLDAAEIADVLDTTVPAVNSALQRARKTVSERIPAKSQQATLRDLGDDARAAIVASYVDAWARSDVRALVALLAEDVRFSMPPIPTWFDGREAVARFFAERVFATPWRIVETRASGQIAFACYQGAEGHLGALNVITFGAQPENRGAIVEITGFLDPNVHAQFRSKNRLPER